MVSSDISMHDVEAAVAATIQPLKEQLKLVEGRERLILQDLQATREMKAVLVSMLRKIDPTMPRPGKKVKQSRNGGVNSDTVNTVRKYVDLIAPENPDGFTRSRVLERMKADGAGFGDKRMIQGMDALHASGYLTLHKLVTGGNKSFKRTEDLDDSARHAV
jgi:hypothetical protein